MTSNNFNQFIYIVDTWKYFTEAEHWNNRYVVSMKNAGFMNASDSETENVNKNYYKLFTSQFSELTALFSQADF